MTSRFTRATLGVALSFLAACGSSELAPPSGAPASQVAVPPLIGGLDVALEKDATKELTKRVRELFRDPEGGPRPYIADGVAYSLREDKELKAVLEVARLTSDANPDDPNFRRAIVDQVGQGSNSPRCGAALTEPPCEDTDLLVYPRTETQKAYFVWFNGRHMFLLMIRQDARTGTTPPDPAAILADAILIQA